MKKGLKISITISILLILIIMGFAAYFLQPYSKSNQLIVYANKNEIESYEEGYISYEDFKLLEIVEDKGNYVELKTKQKLKILGIDSVSVLCDIKADVKDENWDIKAQYQDKKEIVFKFSDFKWNVIEVK